MNHARALACVTVVALLLASAAAQAMDKTIVVLPLDVSKSSGKMSLEARISVEEMIRDEAIDALAGTGWTVLSGETTLKKLKDNGIDPTKCDDQGCHLETAQNMTVPMFISGSVQYVEGTFTASIRLIKTSSGEQLAATHFESQHVLGLRTEFSKKAPEFFHKAGFGAGESGESAPATGPSSAAPPTTTAPAGAAPGVLKVISTPSGAKVSIDGDAAGSTPFTIKKEAGTYVVTIELPGYAPVSRTVELAPGKSAIVNEKLMQAAGYIEVNVQPDGAARAATVTVDGVSAGVGKQGPYKVGKRAVRVEASGYKAADASAEVENGATTPVALSLEALPGKLLLSVNVDADCASGSARVHASASGVAKLEVPAGSAHVACSAEGRDDASADVDVAPGKAVAVKLELKRFTGPTPGKVKVEPKSGLEFVYLPGGSFHMGCEPQDTQCQDNEKPGRSATVSAFWLGKTDVTVAAYTKCVQAGACTAANTDNENCNYGKRSNHPVNCLDWTQAKTFCEWAGGKLPTAEEWEYAAKSGESRVYPWGDQAVNGRLANYCDKRCKDANPSYSWADTNVDDGYGGTSPVGNYPAGATKWGLLDMAGNVWNWTSTDYDASNKERRGGGWGSQPQVLRASGRYWGRPTSWDNDIGLRCGL